MKSHTKINTLAIIGLIVIWLFILLGCSQPVQPEEDFVKLGVVIQIAVGDTARVARIDGMDLAIKYLGQNEKYARIAFTGNDGLSNVSAIALDPTQVGKIFYLQLNKYLFKAIYFFIDKQAIGIIILRRES